MEAIKMNSVGKTYISIFIYICVTAEVSGKLFLYGKLPRIRVGSSRSLVAFSLLNHYCVPPKGDDCVQIYKCPYFDNLLKNSPVPRPHYVISLIQDYQCGFAGNIPQVCCFRDTMINQQLSQTDTTTTKQIPEPIETRKITAEEIAKSTSTSSTEAFTSITTTATGSPIMPSEPISNSLSARSIMDRSNNDIRNHKNYNLLPHEICGPVYDGFKITHGRSATLGEFPWMALIVYKTEDGLDFRCGGSVINQYYILTAAHCIVNSTVIGVRLGEHDISTDKDCEGDYCMPSVQDFYIKKVIVHSNYDEKTSQNDIALIMIDEGADFTYENVQPICLPLQRYNLEGERGMVSGWGVTEDGFRSAELRKTSLPIVSIEKCLKFYKFMTDDQICAGGELGKDSCDGDSGGPLIMSTEIEGTLKYVQYGIVSYGPRTCGEKNQPAVYTRVSNYLEWILDNIEPLKE